MKVISVTKLINKSFKLRESSQPWKDCLGDVEKSFIMLLWGAPFSGKSSFLNLFIAELARQGDTILYVSLEESFSSTSKSKAIRHNLGEYAGKIRFANHETTFETLVEFLSKKRSPTVVIIDSLQYLNMSYIDFKKLKSLFPRKSFIFISHAEGSRADGKTAKKIWHDAGIKIYVEKFIAFIDSRYDPIKSHYVIWEERAKTKWGLKEYKKHIKK